MSAVSRRSRSSTPGAVHDDVGERHQRAPPTTPSRPAGSVARRPPASATALEGVDVTEVVTGEEHRPGVDLRPGSRPRGLLSMPGARTRSTDRGSMTRPLREASRAAAAAAARTPRRGRPSAAWDGVGEPLVLHPGVRGVSVAQRPRQVAQEGREPAGGRGDDPPAVELSARCRTGRRGRAPCPCRRSRCRSSSPPAGRPSAWRAGRR